MTPPILPSFELNSPTTVLLQGWIWLWITHKRWFAIKQRNQRKPIRSGELGESWPKTFLQTVYLDWFFPIKNFVWESVDDSYCQSLMKCEEIHHFFGILFGTWSTSRAKRCLSFIVSLTFKIRHLGSNLHSISFYLCDQYFCRIVLNFDVLLHFRDSQK